MAKKKKGLTIDEVLEHMNKHLLELGYTDVVENLPLVEIDPDQPALGKLAALDDDEVVIFCYPVGEGMAQKVAIQDEGVFWSRLVQGDRIAHFVWVSDGAFDYFFDNNLDFVQF
jgi:hypothetical protein